MAQIRLFKDNGYNIVEKVRIRDTADNDPRFLFNAEIISGEYSGSIIPSYIEAIV